MPKKNTEVVHWTIEEEGIIAQALPALRSQSGKFLLSTKSNAWIDLRDQIPNRSETALNIKVRAMMGRTPNRKKPVLTDMESKSSNEKKDLLRELYGTVTYDQFTTLYNTLK